MTVAPNPPSECKMQFSWSFTVHSGGRETGATAARRVAGCCALGWGKGAAAFCCGLPACTLLPAWRSTHPAATRGCPPAPPRTHVTLVSGTNGSGKSSVMQALQACLGVSARSTGRGTSLAGFIRTGAMDAKLQVRRGDSFHTLIHIDSRGVQGVGPARPGSCRRGGVTHPCMHHPPTRSAGRQVSGRGAGHALVPGGSCAAPAHPCTQCAALPFWWFHVSALWWGHGAALHPAPTHGRPALSRAAVSLSCVPPPAHPRPHPCRSRYGTSAPTPTSPPCESSVARAVRAPRPHGSTACLQHLPRHAAAVQRPPFGPPHNT